jgi:hypothetical protein
MRRSKSTVHHKDESEGVDDREQRQRQVSSLKDDSPLDKDGGFTSEVNDTQAGGEEKDGGDEYASPVHVEQQRGMTILLVGWRGQRRRQPGDAEISGAGRPRTCAEGAVVELPW